MANTIGFKIALMTAFLVMMAMMTDATVLRSEASQSLTVKSHVSMALVAKMATQIEQLQLQVQLQHKQHKQHTLKVKEQAMKIERLEVLAMSHEDLEAHHAVCFEEEFKCSKKTQKEFYETREEEKAAAYARKRRNVMRNDEDDDDP